jgi:hypothetical protein
MFLVSNGQRLPVVGEDLKMFDPEKRLPRKQGAAALTEFGYPTAPATLNTMASRGGGPPYEKYGNRVIYRWGDLLEWARSRTKPPRRSTSEADAPRAA